MLPDARVDIESISGDVRLDLPARAADFDISTFNGEIRNCFGPKAQRTERIRARAASCASPKGSGTARVRIKTMNGDISALPQVAAAAGLARARRFMENTA